MGMPDDRVREVRIAALLHDIGKMSIPAKILSKPGTLSELELGLGLATALGEISDGAGVLYDRTVVETCLRVFESGFDFES